MLGNPGLVQHRSPKRFHVSCVIGTVHNFYAKTVGWPLWRASLWGPWTSNRVEFEPNVIIE